MAASGAHANVEDLKAIAKEIDKAIRAVDESISHVNARISRADWNDSVRRDFEAQFGGAKSAANTLKSRLVELQPALSRHIRKLEEYLG